MDALDQAIRGYMPQYGTNAGHGHVWRRPDGVVARCGGPRMCVECQSDFVELQTARAKVAVHTGVVGSAGGFCPTTQRTRCGRMIPPQCGSKRDEPLQVVATNPTCGLCQRFGSL